MQSRNKREGRYVGHAYGQAVRSHAKLIIPKDYGITATKAMNNFNRSVSSFKARTVLSCYSPKQLGWSSRKTIHILFKRKPARKP